MRMIHVIQNFCCIYRRSETYNQNEHFPIRKTVHLSINKFIIYSLRHNIILTLYENNVSLIIIIF